MKHTLDYFVIYEHGPDERANTFTGAFTRRTEQLTVDVNSTDELIDRILKSPYKVFEQTKKKKVIDFHASSLIDCNIILAHISNYSLEEIESLIQEKNLQQGKIRTLDTHLNNYGILLQRQESISSSWFFPYTNKQLEEMRIH